MQIIPDYTLEIPIEVDCKNVALLPSLINRQPNEVKDLPEQLIYNFIAVGYVYVTQNGYSPTAFGQIVLDDYMKRQSEADKKALEIEQRNAKTLNPDCLIVAILQAVNSTIPLKTPQGNVTPIFNVENLSCLYVSVLGFLMATRQDLYYDKMPPVTFAAANGQLRPNIDIIQQVLTLLRTVEVNQLPPVSPIIGSAVAEIVSYYIPSFGSIQKRNEYQILSRDVLNHKAKLLNHKTLMKLYTQLCSQHNNSIAKAVEYNTPS